MKLNANFRCSEKLTKRQNIEKKRTYIRVKKKFVSEIS